MVHIRPQLPLNIAGAWTNGGKVYFDPNWPTDIIIFPFSHTGSYKHLNSGQGIIKRM